MIIDTHAHYDDEQFGNNVDTLVAEMCENGVDKILTCATKYENFDTVINLCDKFENMYCAIGVYPHDTHLQGEFNKDLFVEKAKHKKVVAIGEIGLDYYYDDSPKETQLDWARKQLQIANELHLPITFHDREAHADSLNLFKEFRPKGVVHCYSGSVETANEIIKLGMFLGIGGAATFKNAKVLPQVIKEIPLEYFVLETDAPYMSPVPMRGKTNRSDYIKYIALKIAEIKNISVDEVFETTSNTAQKIFKFGEK